MKIRLTLLTENDKQRPPELTEEKVKAAWQAVVDTVSLMSDSDDTCVVEKAEFVEEVIPEQTEQKRGRNTLSDYPSLFQCSACGCWCDDTYYLNISKFNYCPNCGARMEESE